MSKLVLVAALFLSACVETESHDFVELELSDDAARVVADVYGMSPQQARVSWSLDMPNGVAGMATGCNITVLWWSPQWTTGAAADGPAISSTAFAHEMAHCALHLQGVRDQHHERAEWWAADGMVSRANAELRRHGI